MTIFAAIAAYAAIMYVLLTKVKDGLVYTPVIGLGLGYIIGTAIAEQFGFAANVLGGMLALVLGLGPPLAVFISLRWRTHKECKRPSAAELARLEHEVEWKPYDPSWLVALAREQQPGNKALHGALAGCTKCVELDGRTCFVNPVLITHTAGAKTFLRLPDGDAVLIFYLPWGDIASVERGRALAKPASRNA